MTPVRSSDWSRTAGPNGLTCSAANESKNVQKVCATAADAKSEGRQPANWEPNSQVRANSSPLRRRGRKAYARPALRLGRLSVVGLGLGLRLATRPSPLPLLLVVELLRLRRQIVRRGMLARQNTAPQIVLRTDVTQDRLHLDLVAPVNVGPHRVYHVR